MLDDLTRLFPTNATLAGVKGNDHLWDDLSPSGVTATSEVTRYSSWPSQAISYKVGERAILDMRRQLSDEAGENFDLKSFHHQQLLEIGPVGIDTVRTLLLGNDKQQ